MNQQSTKSSIPGPGHISCCKYNSRFFIVLLVLLTAMSGWATRVNKTGKIIPPPTLTVNPQSIAGFTTVKNQPSAAKTYTVTATNLTADLSVNITAPANYELKLPGIGAFTSALTLTQNITGGINRVVEVRLKATAITGSITGAIQNNLAGLIKNVTLTGIVNAPSLSTTTNSLAFTAIKNQASLAKMYKVTATNLATGNTAVITASAAYEVSTSSTGVFMNTITLLQNGVNGITADIFVRVKASAVTGTVTGSIQHEVAGLTKVITLSAVVAAPLLSVNPISLNGFSTIKNRASATRPYTIVASNLVTGVSASISAPPGYEISVPGSDVFSTSMLVSQTATGSITQTILVRLKAQAVTGTITGNITHSVAGLVKTLPVTGVVSNIILTRGKIANTMEEGGNLLLNERDLAVSIFPNPVTDLFTVKLSDSEEQPAQLRLVDLEGRVILAPQLPMQNGLQQVRLSLAAQKPGAYFLEIKAGDKRKSLQLIKL